MTTEVGDRAPTFTLVDETGAEVSSAELYSTPTVIFFYPAAMTPGCTAEACDFRDSYETMQEAGYQVVGISPDRPDRNAKFRAKEGLPFQLLSDEDHAVAEAFGAWGTKNLYGKKFDGLIRSTFLVGDGGKIVRAWRNVRAKGHVAKVTSELLNG
ncbi:MAG TPA: thioredoxin-dependent thiol peroxidase [Acidimicrobiia bacterium]|jgi:peroxiredoxin Q/BCP|nr:thioredoxin-dependent thiol peroxidase [Acidimicrobiia bacterium]